MKELLSIFELGAIISTNHSNQPNWVNNSILDTTELYDDILKIQLKQQYIDDSLSIGDLISLKTVSRGCLYLTKCIITEISSNPEYLKVKVESLEILDEDRDKRVITRYKVQFDCIIKGPNISINENPKVINISSTGIGILTSQNITIGESVFVDIFLEDEKVLKLSGKVVRKKTAAYSIEYGINSNPVDDTNQDILNNLLEELSQRRDEEKSTMSIIKKIRSQSATNNE